MKRIVLTLGLLAAINCVAFADGNAFTPLNFNDTQYGNPSASTAKTTAATSSAPAATSMDGDAVGNGNIQNAILQLDNAAAIARNPRFSTSADKEIPSSRGSTVNNTVKICNYRFIADLMTETRSKPDINNISVTPVRILTAMWLETNTCTSTRHMC